MTWSLRVKGAQKNILREGTRSKMDGSFKGRRSMLSLRRFHRNDWNKKRRKKGVRKREKKPSLRTESKLSVGKPQREKLKKLGSQKQKRGAHRKGANSQQKGRKAERYDGGGGGTGSSKTNGEGRTSGEKSGMTTTLESLGE